MLVVDLFLGWCSVSFKQWLSTVLLAVSESVIGCSPGLGSAPVPGCSPGFVVGPSPGSVASSSPSLIASSSPRSVACPVLVPSFDSRFVFVVEVD